MFEEKIFGKRMIEKRISGGKDGYLEKKTL